ncbi:hypothetical protein D9M72_484100 [compost metagenome]
MLALFSTTTLAVGATTNSFLMIRFTPEFTFKFLFALTVQEQTVTLSLNCKSPLITIAAPSGEVLQEVPL